MNFIERKDNLLTKKECADAIEWVLKHKIMIPDSNKETTIGYDYCNLMDEGEDRHQCFSSIPLRPIYRAINTLKDFYIKSFPEVKWIHPWTLQYVRFKWWKPGYSFSNWHSEHDSVDLSLLIKTLNDNVDKSKNFIKDFANYYYKNINFSDDNTSTILDTSIITPRDSWDINKEKQLINILRRFKSN